MKCFRHDPGKVCPDCGADRRNIRTTLQPNGEYSAIDDDTYDGEGSAMGWGATPEAAIEDLKEQIADRSFARQDGLGYSSDYRWG